MQMPGALPKAPPESEDSLHARMHAAALTAGFAAATVAEDAVRVFRFLADDTVIPLIDSFTEVCPQVVHHL